MTENISHDAASRREAARSTSGQFGTQPLAEADLELEDHLNLEVVKAALPPGPEATYHRLSYADLSAIANRCDDVDFFDDPDTHDTRVRISTLASAFADRDKTTRDAAVPAVLALNDVPGGILEGQTAHLQAAIDADKFGYLSGFRFVDPSSWLSRRRPLREEHRTMLAALTENHLRGDDPAPSGDARELNIHPDQYQPEEMTAAELAEVHRRLSLSRNFSAENTDETIDKVRAATRGMTLRGVWANDGQATQLTEELTEIGVQQVERARTSAGDPTGDVIATTPGGRTLTVGTHMITGPAGHRQINLYGDRTYGLRQEIRIAATADVLSSFPVGDRTLLDAAVREHEHENGNGIDFVAAGETIHFRDPFAEAQTSDTLVFKTRIEDTEQAMVMQVLVTETGIEVENWPGYPEMGEALLSGRDRSEGVPAGTHAAALRQAHARLVNDPDLAL